MLIALRKIIKICAYYLVPLIVGLWSFINPDLEVFATWGTIALYLVYTNLFIKPWSVILPNPLFRFVLSQRRQMGVAAFWFFIFHGGGMIYTHQLYSPSLFTDFIFWGALAGLGVFILGITSNNIASRMLKKNWKRLQMIVAYPTFFLIAWHSSNAKGEVEGFYFVAGFFVILKIIENVIKYVKRKRAKQQTNSINT